VTTFITIFREWYGRRDSGRALNFSLVSKTGYLEAFYWIEALLMLEWWQISLHTD